MADESTSTVPRRETRRDTWQRRAVVETLGAAEAFVSAQHIHHEMRTGGQPVGLATVYRNLQALAEDGLVDTLRAEDGEVRYRRCAPAHHHHLVCRSCGKVVEVQSRSVEAWATAVAAEHGFVDAAHSVEVSGVCPDCAARA